MLKCVVLHPNRVPRNVGVLQHTCTAAQRNSPPEFILLPSEGIHTCPPETVTSCPHFAVQHTKRLLCSQHEKKKKSFITGDKKKNIRDFFFLSLFFILSLRDSNSPQLCLRWRMKTNYANCFVNLKADSPPSSRTHTDNPVGPGNDSLLVAPPTRLWVCLCGASMPFDG